MNKAIVPELSIADLATSLDFYVRVLGFDVSFRREEEGFAYLALGGAELMLDQIDLGRTWRTAPFERPLGRGVNFYIEVERIEPILTRIRAEGISLYLDVEEKWYRAEEVEYCSRQFLVQDPDGYLLRFAEEAGERPAIAPESSV